MPSVLEVQNICKGFGGVRALQDVSFGVERGARHALLGENGAGKSTLIKILAGEHTPDSGTLLLDGAVFRPASPADVRRAGVFVVPQELSYCPNLSVAENLLLGELGPRMSRFGFARHSLIKEEAARRLQRIGLNEINPAWPMAGLSTGQAQAVQIAGAVSSHPKLLLLDEPTSALSRGETARLAGILKQLKDEGVTVLYVSHRMEEIFGSSDSGFAPCDAYTVFRDGRHVETAALAGKSEAQIVNAMIGRELQHEHLPHLDKEPSGDVRLKVEDLTDAAHGRFTAISLELRAGEVLGIAGLVGAGRTELARALVGLDAGATGKVWLNGERFDARDVRASLRRGLVYLTEDRKREGLVLNLSGTANWSLPFVGRFGALGGALLKRGAERDATATAFADLKVKTPHPDAAVKGLSGGNQQKVLFARWLSIDPPPRVVILDEPTRGVDVGSKAEIHRLVANLALGGAAVMVISSDLPELLAVSTRLTVMRGGRIAGTLSRAEMNEQAIGRMMLGVG